MKVLKQISLVFFVFTLGLNGSVLAQTKKIPPKKTAPAASVKSESENFNNKERYALIIGNQSYPRKPLDKPISDGKTLAKSLRQVGFNVTSKYDLGLAEMKTAIGEFSQSLPQGSVALLFFAGHGVQISGKNFLLPVDYNEIEAADDFVREMVNLDSTVESMSQKSGLNIIILDACRDNPTELALPVSVEEGLAPFKQITSGGSFIAYSTAPHTKAFDDSPYIRSLSKNILMNPGRIEDIFIKTRIDVENETEEQQVPWESASLKTIFYFNSFESSKLPEAVKAVVKKVLAPKLPFGIASLQTFSFVSPVVNDKGKRASIINGTAKYFNEVSKNANIEMVEIKGGDFEMGSSAAEVERAFKDAKKYKGDDSEDEESDDTEYTKKESKDFITAEMPKHPVTVPGFYMSKYEITQGQWRNVMGSMPKSFQRVAPAFKGDDFPVVSVTWEEAKAFCDRLTDSSGRFYRLPSEAEWEYAARAGKDQEFGYGGNINASVANYFAAAPFGHDQREQNRLTLLTAGNLNAANPFGLFDMHGNVAEWTADYWNDDYSGAPDDGSAWEEANEDDLNTRVIRGGGWDSIGNDCRSAARRKHPAIVASPKIGFRIVFRQDS